MVNIQFDTTNVSIGQMRSNISFKNNTNKTASGAGFIDGYVSFLTTKGFLQKKQGYRSGQRTNEFGEVLFEEFYTLICRFQTSLESNLKTDTIIECDGRTFIITNYQLIDEKRFYYHFTLTGKNG